MMRQAIPTDLLLRLMSATPEQYAAVERILGCDGAGLQSMPGWSRNVFAKSGSVWRVVFEGEPEFHLDDTLGARYLDYLLHHPNEPISAFDLEVVVVPEKREVRERNSIQNGIDGEATREYLREVEQLRAERDHASERGNFAEAERLDEAIEALVDELKKCGRSVDTGERARGNVRKAIGAVRDKLLKLGGAEKAFGEHIAAQICLGYKCSYNVPKGTRWE